MLKKEKINKEFISWYARIGAKLGNAGEMRAKELGLSKVEYTSYLLMKDTGCYEVDNKQKFLIDLAKIQDK